MQLSLKGKTFSQLLCAIFEMDIKLPSKRRPSCIFEISDLENRG